MDILNARATEPTPPSPLLCAVLIAGHRAALRRIAHQQDYRPCARLTADAARLRADIRELEAQA